MALTLNTPQDTLGAVRDRFKARRLAMNLTQNGLAARAGVALGSLKRFEQTGLVSFDSLLKLALVLECLGDFDKVCVDDMQALSSKSLEQVLASSKRRRKGRLT